MGLVNVEVQYEVAMNLAVGFGLTQADVMKTIEEDNEDRRAQLENQLKEQNQTEAPEQLPLVQADTPIYGDEPDRFFEPCSEDELEDEAGEMDQDL